VLVGNQTRDTGHGRKETRTVHPDPGRAGLSPRTAGRPDHPDPHDQGQNHPRNGVPDRVPARRTGPARRPGHLGTVRVAPRESPALRHGRDAT
jgi:hypothetical protein